MEVNLISAPIFNKKNSPNTIKQRKMTVFKNSTNQAMPASLMKVYFGADKKSKIPEAVINYRDKKGNSYIPVAKTTAVDENDKPVDIFLSKKENSNKNSRIKYVALSRSGEELGYTKLSVEKGKYAYGRISREGPKYVDGYVDLIFIDSSGRKLPNKIYSVGSRLNQLVVEKSFKEGFEGRVALKSAPCSSDQPEEYIVKHSFPFHYKSGFRMEQPMQELSTAFKNKLTEKEQASMKKIDFDGCQYYNAEKFYEKTGKIDEHETYDMFLPEENIKKLRNKDGCIEIFDKKHL